jgi:hypothetical protein
VPDYIPVGCAAGLGALHQVCPASGSSIVARGAAAAVNGSFAAGGGGAGGGGGFAGLTSMRDGEKHTWVGADGVTYTVTRVGPDPDWKPPATNGSASLSSLGGTPSAANATTTRAAIRAAVEAAAAAAGAGKAAAAAANSTGVGVLWDVSAGSSTAPGCSTSLDCYCDGVVDGTMFANPFNVSYRNYVLCQMGYSFEASCDASAEFNATSGKCVQTPASLAAGDADVCAGNATGFAPRRLVNGSLEYVECIGGAAVLPCAAGFIRAGPTNNTCVNPANTTSPERAAAQAAPVQALAVQAQVRPPASRGGLRQRLGGRRGAAAGGS